MSEHFKESLPPSYEEATIFNSTAPESYKQFQNESSKMNLKIRISTNPTLKPYPNFNVNLDVQRINNALKSRLDKDTLIEILCKRTSEQRMEIMFFYQQTTNHSLIQDLKKTTSKNFYKVLSGLSIPYYEFLARSLHRTFMIKWLFFIILTIPNDEILKMKSYFEEKYNTTVDQYLNILVGSDDHLHEIFYLKPLKRLLEARRNEQLSISQHEVNNDVERLIKIRSGSLFDGQKNEKEILKDIFYYKSLNHIKSVSLEYYRKTNTPIFDAIHKCYGSDRNNVFQNIARYALDKNDYFAYLLKISMKGLSKNNELLIHIIIRRAEIDLGNIKTEFRQKHGDLRNWVKECSSGHYKYALYALMGETRTN